MTRAHGFTLIELLSVLLIFSILALLSYRGLDSVLQSRENLTQQAAKWRSIASFFSRFERDVQLAAEAIATQARRKGIDAFEVWLEHAIESPSERTSILERRQELIRAAIGN